MFCFISVWFCVMKFGIRLFVFLWIIVLGVVLFCFVWLVVWLSFRFWRFCVLVFVCRN